MQRGLAPRPSIVAGRSEFTYTRPIVGIPLATAPSLLDRSYRLTANIEVPAGGAEGMLVTAGGRFGGFGFYLHQGKPVFLYNLLDLARYRVAGAEALSPGRHTVAFDFKYDGPGLGKSGTGILSVDGKEVARQVFPHTVPISFEISETFDIGADTGGGVDDRDYRPPFRFTGTLHKLTVKLDRPQLTAADEERLLHAWLKKGVND